MRPRPRWGPLPWFVLVLTGLLVLLVVVLPPFVLDEVPPAWLLRNAARLASYHGDPDPIEAEWLASTRAEAAELMKPPPAEPSPSPSVAPDETSPSAAPQPSVEPTPIDEPERTVQVVVMRGRFDSAPPGGPPPPDAPERWIVVAYDNASHDRWRLAVLPAPPSLPEDARTFEF